MFMKLLERDINAMAQFHMSAIIFFLVIPHFHHHSLSYQPHRKPMIDHGSSSSIINRNRCCLASPSPTLDVTFSTTTMASDILLLSIAHLALTSLDHSSTPVLPQSH